MDVSASLHCGFRFSHGLDARFASGVAIKAHDDHLPRHFLKRGGVNRHGNGKACKGSGEYRAQNGTPAGESVAQSGHEKQARQ